MKQAALLDVQITTEQDTIKKAELTSKRDKLIDGLSDFVTDKPTLKQIEDVWNGYEELTFNMARASQEGMKVMDFDKMTTYAYMKYKKMMLNTMSKNNNQNG